MAVEPLFEAHLFQQIVDVDGDRLFDHAVDLDRPRPQLEGLRVAPDRLVHPEFVEIIVGRRIFLVGQRPVERVFFAAFCRVKPGRRVCIGRQRRREPAETGSQDRSRRQALQEPPAIMEHRFAGRRAVPQLPAALPADQHVVASLAWPGSMWARQRQAPSHAFASDHVDRQPLGRGRPQRYCNARQARSMRAQASRSSSFDVA